MTVDGSTMPKNPYQKNPPKSPFEAGMEAVREGEALVERAKEEIGPKPKSIPPLPPNPTRAEDYPSVEARITHIVEIISKNRAVAAGVALVELKRWFASDPAAFGHKTWDAFVIDRFAGIDPSRLRLLIGGVLHRGGTLHCTECGATSLCLCSCGSTYLPAHYEMPSLAAIDRAMAAIEKNPELSDRAIAEKIGVSHQVVGRARRKIKEGDGDGPLDGPVEGPISRVGRDGRSRRLPQGQDLRQDPERDLIQDEYPDAVELEDRWQMSAANAAGDAIAMRAFWSRQFGGWEKFEPPAQLKKLAAEAAAAWQALDKKWNRRK